MTDQPPPSPDTPSVQTSASELAYAAGVEATHNKWLLLIVGIVTLIGGVVALIMPLFASVAVALVTAWVLITSGIVGIFAAFRRRHGWHMVAAFFSAVLSVVIGILILVQPILGLLTITMLIIVFFAISGLLRLYYGMRLLKDGTGGGWMIAGGVLSLALAAVLISGLPFSAAWVPGVLLGIDLITWGVILIAVAARAAQLSAAQNRSDRAFEDG